MKIGCCGITDDLEIIQRQGYDYAELSARQIMSLDRDAFARFLERFYRLGLPCYGFNSFCGADLPLVGPDQNIGRLEAYLSELCSRGQLLGIHTIGVGAPAARKPPPDWPEYRSDEQMLQFLQLACEVAASYEISILLEAVHSGLCSYLNHTEHAVRLASQMHATNSGLVLDYYHARMMTESYEDLGFAMSMVRHLHVSGGAFQSPRLFPKTEEDEADLLSAYRSAKSQGYSGNTVSVEADRRFLKEDGLISYPIMKKIWK